MKTRFLTTVCALLTLAVLLGGCSAGAEKAPKKEVGIQLYSVRSLIGAFGNNQEDYKPVLKQLAVMRYTSVGAASYKEGKSYGQSPEPSPYCEGARGGRNPPPALRPELLEELLAAAGGPSGLTGKDGLLKQLTAALVNKALDAEIRTLQTEIDRLQTDGEVEARAREEYHMARPGEEAVALLPPVPAPVTIPSGWPYSRLFAATR